MLSSIGLPFLVLCPDTALVFATLEKRVAGMQRNGSCCVLETMWLDLLPVKGWNSQGREGVWMNKARDDSF